jgi:valyl-tRNA synthetase
VCLRLLHPFTPFVTEELWGHLRRALAGSPLADIVEKWPDALIIAPWPEMIPEEGWEAGKKEDFSLVQDIIRSIRNLRAERKVSPAKRIPAGIAAGVKYDLLKDQSAVISALAGLDPAGLTIQEALEPAKSEEIVLVVGSVEVRIPLAGMVDMDAERQRLEKELAGVMVQVDRLEKLLASDFVNKAPAPVVQKERERLAALQETAEKLNAQLG